MPAPPAPSRPEPEPEPESEELDIALPEMDDDDDPMAAFATDDDDDDASDDDALSSDDIEKMFGDDDEPAPLGSMVDSNDEDDEDDEDITGFDDLDEPEPIPQVFTADETGDDEFEDDDEDDEPHSKGSLLKIILAVILAVFVLTAGAVFIFKDAIIEAVPATEGALSLLSFGHESLGEGLSINDVKSARESIGGQDVLVVRGLIVNVSKKERSVPLLELRLSDLDGKLVQSASTAPIKTHLAVGDQIGFKIQVENPSALARRLEVTFTEGEGAAKTGHGEAPAKAH